MNKYDLVQYLANLKIISKSFGESGPSWLNAEIAITVSKLEKEIVNETRPK